ncbi:helix-turn-helix domain-containing protein [Clostridium polynesiense]|uniref:helix-turn-helix domain-containing protein n=1 Tax=Clostridium polynesiense TaxID=1325933 RepID=UPI00058E9683|nr:helix-turn-helix domain-containing protein [Clostridium polynesiense]
MKYYTVNELAEQLKVHPETIKREIYRNNLRAFKVGSELRFTQESVDDYTNALNRGKTTREIELEDQIVQLKKALSEKEKFIELIKLELLKIS